MTKSLFAFSAFSALVIASTASAEEMREYNFPAFTAVDVASGVQAEVTAGEAQSIRVYTDKGDFSDLEIGVNGGVLSVKREWRKGWGAKRANYRVVATVQDLSGVEASSGSDITVRNVSDGDFEIDASSGASVDIAGNCSEVTAEASSGASVDARDLSCTSADADASSGASLVLFASESVSAEASSGASVVVYGGAEAKRIKKSSGGSVKVKN